MIFSPETIAGIEYTMAGVISRVFLFAVTVVSFVRSFIRTLICESMKDFCSKPQKSSMGGAIYGN